MKRLGPIALFALLLTSGLLGAPLSATAQTQSSTGTPGDVDFWEELAFWESIKDTSNPAEIEAYLSAYPDGRFRRLAELRLSSLRSANAAGGAAEPSRTPPPRSDQDKKPSAEKGAKLRAGSIIQDCAVCPKLVVVPAGSFVMGSDRGHPEDAPRILSPWPSHSRSASTKSAFRSGMPACAREPASSRPTPTAT